MIELIYTVQYLVSLLVVHQCLFLLVNRVHYAGVFFRGVVYVGHRERKVSIRQSSAYNMKKKSKSKFVCYLITDRA